MYDEASIRAAVRHLRRADPILADVMRRVGPFSIRLERNRFQALVRSIIAQQISGKAARSIWRRLQESIRPRRLTAEVIAGIPIERLRSLGLSPQKASYVHDLAAKVSEGSVRLHRVQRMTDDDVIAELIQVKGVGVWTAQMFLIFSLGRLDVFPQDDLGVRMAIRRHYGLAELPDKARSLQIASPWRPYATVASWYCWRSLDGDGAA